MKILYAIQGTGNGHLSRARDIIPALQQQGEVDILVSGCQADLTLPFDITYRMRGLSFVFGKKGGIDYAETYKRSNVKALYREIRDLPVQQYDLVISDFEPVSAWACRLRGKPCVGLSHQAAVVSKHAPRPRKTDWLGSMVLQYYAPTDLTFGFHFLPYGKRMFSPVIRQEVRQLAPTSDGHYTVYLPAYSDERIARFLGAFPAVEWEVFSKKTTAPYSNGNCHFFPVSNEGFLHSMARATGVLCGAGFETPAEVMFLNKKLMVVPMKGQYEQQCNAAALQMMGVPVIKKLKAKQQKEIGNWLEEGMPLPVSYPDETAEIVWLVISQYKKKFADTPALQPITQKPGAFRESMLRKIFSRP